LVEDLLNTERGGGDRQMAHDVLMGEFSMSRSRWSGALVPGLAPPPTVAEPEELSSLPVPPLSSG
jgi:hypothetical protein